MQRCVAVAWSGGRDSTALLHATLTEAALHGIQVVALHVHHGLSPQADAWLSHCKAQAARWARAARPVTFAAHRLDSMPAAGQSIEAWARTARYAALHAMALAHGASVVLLAHHQRDQAETLLLQALRGGGVAGLAGMPASVCRGGVQWQRPWLNKSSDEIDAYVRRHRLKHIVDDSNADPRYARNRLRLQVWPALAQAFPQVESTVATSARWAQEANDALAELAAMDLAQVSTPDGLAVAPWLLLSPARRSNALRAWLKQLQGMEAAPATLIERLMAELPTRRSARWPWADAAELRLYRGELVVVAKPQAKEPAQSARETSLAIRAPGVCELPGWHGRLLVETVAEGGVPLAWLAHVELRERAGSEQFQSGLGRPPRSLKKQFQQAGVPIWKRTGPLVYSGGQLVYVPGLGLDARVVGLPGQPAMMGLNWLPDTAAD